MLPIHTSGLGLGNRRDLCAGRYSPRTNTKNYCDGLTHWTWINICLLVLVFSVSDGQVVPRKFQLEAGLATYQGKNTIVNAGTGSGKTLSMAIPLLMDPDAVAIIISPLKRL